MKQGKVFEKLAARKNVKGITFQDKTCTVLLTDGKTKVCSTAHEARLFIEGKDVSGATQVVAPAAAPIQLPETPTPTELCGTDARTIVLDASFVRRAAGDLVSIPAGVKQVRVTVDAAAALIAGGNHRF